MGCSIKARDLRTTLARPLFDYLEHKENQSLVKNLVCVQNSVYDYVLENHSRLRSRSEFAKLVLISLIKAMHLLSKL